MRWSIGTGRDRMSSASEFCSGARGGRWSAWRATGHDPERQHEGGEPVRADCGGLCRAFGLLALLLAGVGCTVWWRTRRNSGGMKLAANDGRRCGGCDGLAAVHALPAQSAVRVDRRRSTDLCSRRAGAGRGGSGGVLCSGVARDQGQSDVGAAPQVKVLLPAALFQKG